MAVLSTAPQTDMFKSKTDTVTISDTVLKLDSLYASYDAVLAEVKQQLADIDVTDDQISRIANNLAELPRLRDAVAERTVVDLAASIADASANDLETNKQMCGLIDAIANRVMVVASDAIGRVIETKIAEAYPEEKMVELLTEHVLSQRRIAQGFEAAMCLDQMLKYLGYTKVSSTSSN